jgi:hypothetical protein
MRSIRPALSSIVLALNYTTSTHQIVITSMSERKSPSDSVIRKKDDILVSSTTRTKDPLTPHNGEIFVLIGFFLAITPILGIQQIILTVAPAVLILCICHWVALRIFLRRV